jgi:uncharacterized protein YjbI with pentapeptide repeats
MSESYFSNEQFQQLKADNQKLAEENLRLRTELEAYRMSQKGKKGVARGIGWLGAGIFLGKRFKKSLIQLFTEIPQKNVTHETLANVTAHALWRFTRVTLFGLLIAVIPAAILIFQTLLMRSQNRMIQRQSEIMDLQNDLVSQQNQLIGLQLKQDDINTQKSLFAGEVNTSKRYLQNLSNRGIDEQAAQDVGKRLGEVSRKINAYELSPDGKGSLSPERGELLEAFIAATKRLPNLERFAHLVYGEAPFYQADLEKAILVDANLRGAILNEANLTEANLRGADLENAQLNNAILDKAPITNASLFATNLSNASAKGTLFNASDLRNANFSAADLSGADLRGVNDLQSANFTETILLNVKVSDPNWLAKMDDQNIVGWNDLRSKYIVDNTEQRDANGVYFLIIER